MDAQDFFVWRSNLSNAESASGDEDVAADADEPPERRSALPTPTPDFHKSAVKLSFDRKESLLARAFAKPFPPTDSEIPNVHIATDITRRRSSMSITSAASTADLTSDGGITSPARTNTPSPPFPTATTTYMSFAPYTLGPKATHPILPPMVKPDSNLSRERQHVTVASISKPDPAIEALVKKRCISFACGAQKPKAALQSTPKISPKSKDLVDVNEQKEAPKRTMIKFACPAPKAAEKSHGIKEKESMAVAPLKTTGIAHPVESASLHHTRTPSGPKKVAQPTIRHRDSTSTIRRTSQSPVAVRTRKPKFIVADEEELKLSEATRFHEFASDVIQEDDWIRKDISESKARLTIKDTLKKENAIRQLGEEAEEEALQEEEDEDDEDDDDEDDDNEEEDDQDFDDETIDGSGSDGSDGNETDNEAGFADSDDESDTGGDFHFWAPGRPITAMSGEGSVFRATAHRTASESSIDSLKHMSPIARISNNSSRRRRSSRQIRIRPGTPDLPDSTDFVCGTLDEDRPLEDAYVSCMEARKREKHHAIPQDIDPSFPTSDPENEEDNDDIEQGHDSDEQVWLHGKFEDSEEDDARRRRRSIRKSPAPSPKRPHSPPPKHRHRSPPPTRRLFGGHSPKRMRSPPPARNIRSPAASPNHDKSYAISFAPLGSCPGLTHTKSLPRTPNAFCRQYRASRIIAANGNIADGSDTADGHTRGAIDIVKGLEQRRQRRKEKFNQKHCNRARKGQQPERRAVPGKGAERMRELVLQMTGRVETRAGKAEFVLSV
jgi:hypothetical protein